MRPQVKIILRWHGDPDLKRIINQIIPDLSAVRLDECDAIRIEDDFAFIADWEYYNTDQFRGEYMFLDAAIPGDLQELISIFGGSTQASPAEPDSVPMIRDCIVITGRSNSNLESIVRLVSSIDGRIGECISAGGGGFTNMVAISSVSPGWTGSSDYYPTHEPFNAWPVFRADQIKDLERFLKATIPKDDMAKSKKKKNDPRDRKPDKPTTGNCTIVGLNPQLSEHVQYILFEAGHSWPNDSDGYPKFTSKPIIVCGEWASSLHKGSLVFSENLDKVKGKKNWPVFDASREMDKIYQFFGCKIRTLSIERIVKPGLLSMIKTMPANELVAGFIRRDLELVIPPEVQANGTDSICEWILDQKAGKNLSQNLDEIHAV